VSGVTGPAERGTQEPAVASSALSVAVTGGIGAGKSTVTAGLADHGGVVVDSDRLARDVVAPGTPGLAAVAAEFGPSVLTADGALDRAAVAAIVFGDPAARRRLEQITHPLVRRAADELKARAPLDAVVVNDIPLLRDLPTAAHFHLVIGVGAALDVRLARLRERGLTDADARARIAAQIDDEERRRLCDVWLDNSGDRAVLAEGVRGLWPRLREFADLRLAGRRRARGAAVLTGPDPRWPELARLLAARVADATGVAEVSHIGSTAVPGLPAKDVIDLQLAVPDLRAADRLGSSLADAGFPVVAGVDRDTPHPPDDDSALWAKRLHASADPGRPVNLHLRVQGSPGYRFALLFPAWLTADAQARAEYLRVKRRAEAEGLGTIDDYAMAKEPWLAQAYPRALAWAERTGWSP